MASGSKKVIITALIGNSLIAVTKFIAAFITNSSAMLSEGIHSLVDTGNQCLLLYGLKSAKKPADSKFPFGHGKEIYFWSFVVAILIFALGAGISIYEGIHQIMDPQAINKPIINYIVLSLSMAFEGGATYVAFKEFTKVKGDYGFLQAIQRGKDPSMFVVLFEDSAAMLGLLIAFIGVGLSHLTGITYFDGIASICIGLILGGTAIWLAYETKSLLIGESANREDIANIRRIASSYAVVEHVNEILTLHMGPEFILVNISIDFTNNIQSGEIEKTIDLISKEIKKSLPFVKRIFIEAENKSTIARQ